jgi:hypothetical protein
MFLSCLSQINGVLNFADNLCSANHYASDKVRRRADAIAEHRDANRQRARDKLEHLKDFLHLQKFFQVWMMLF